VSNFAQWVTCLTTTAQHFHLLEDSAYPLLPSLLVSYRDSGYLTEAQRQFNVTNSSARSTLGRLKGKFRRLENIDATCTHNALQTTEAVLTLHNFILHQNCEEDDDFAKDQEPGMDDANDGPTRNY